MSEKINVFDELENEFNSLQNPEEIREFVKNLIIKTETILSRVDGWEDVVEEVHEGDEDFKQYSQMTTDSEEDEDTVNEDEELEEEEGDYPPSDSELELMSIIPDESYVVFDDESNKSIVKDLQEIFGGHKCSCEEGNSECSCGGGCHCGGESESLIKPESTIVLQKVEDGRILVIIDNMYGVPMFNLPEDLQNKILEETKKA